MLTLLTSGSIANLRPDRVLAVLRPSRRRYHSLVAGFFAGFIAGIWGVAGMAIEMNRDPTHPNAVPLWLTGFTLDIALMVTATFMMHLFCWQLGLIYREHHAMFPWAYQYHKRKYSDSIGAARLKGPRKPPIPRQKLKATVSAQTKATPAAPPLHTATPTQTPSTNPTPTVLGPAQPPTTTNQSVLAREPTLAPAVESAPEQSCHHRPTPPRESPRCPASPNRS